MKMRRDAGLPRIGPPFSGKKKEGWKRCWGKDVGTRSDSFNGGKVLGVSVLEGGLELGFGVRGLDFWRNGAGGGDQVGW